MQTFETVWLSLLEKSNYPVLAETSTLKDATTMLSQKPRASVCQRHGVISQENGDRSYSVSNGHTKAGVSLNSL